LTDPFNHLHDLLEQGDYAAALPVANQLLALRLLHFGPGHEDTANAANYCGLIHLQLGNFGVALSAYQRALAGC
jgi:tetratricopeptide (TPR) repeat protein